MENDQAGGNFIKNTKTSKGRTVRLEVVGGVTEAEKHFLSGISFFAAGTLSKDSEEHVTYVSDIMTKLIRSIIAKIKKDGYSAADISTKNSATDAVARLDMAAQIKEEAAQLRQPTNFLIKNVSSVVTNAVEIEKTKGTPPEHILTMACGALAATMAQLYSPTNKMGITMPRKVYIDIVNGMLNSALDNLDKKKEDNI